LGGCSETQRSKRAKKHEGCLHDDCEGAEKPNRLRNDKRNADVKLLLQHQVEIKGNADENLSSRETTIRAKGKKSSRGDRYHG
jgi:hypothetical protein